MAETITGGSVFHQFIFQKSALFLVVKCCEINKFLVAPTPQSAQSKGASIKYVRAEGE